MQNPYEPRGHAGTGSGSWGSDSQDAWGKSYTTGVNDSKWAGTNRNPPKTKSWWQGLAPFDTHPQRGSTAGYAPDWDSQGLSYFPDSYYGRASLNEIIAKWNRDEAERLGLNNWTQTQGGYDGDVGKVYRGKAIGMFADYPGVDDEIQSSAQAYGIPVNFLKAIIAHESSGDWEANNYVNTTARPEMGELLPYIGVFKVAADSRGLGELYTQARTGNRGAQINLLAAVLRSQASDVLGRNPTYGWLNVAAYHYSGDPSGNSTPADSTQYGTAQQYMAKVESWWKMMDIEAGNTWSNTVAAGGGGSGPVASLGGDWAGVDRWNSQISAASAKYGVDANLIKSVMRLESNGDAGSGSPQGATGLMQIMPFWNGTNGLSIYDPAQNIELGAFILKQNYQQYGTWDMAVKAYIGLEGADAYGTTADSYLTRIKQYQQQLSGSSTIGGGGGGGGGQIGGIWGSSGIPGITQEFGPTDWSQGEGAWMYNYAKDYGMTGHTGVDYGMVPGEMLYSPVAGTVEVAGGSGYFRDDRGDAPGIGELRIKLDNGQEVILGHMEYIGVKVGDRITPGQYVGKSGTANGGHVHVEYRIPDPSTNSGWRIVDPRAYLNGSFSSPVVTTTGNAPQSAMSYMEMVRAITLGKPVYTEGGLSDDTLGSGWRGYLRNFTLGKELGVRIGQTINDIANNALNGVSGSNPYNPSGPGNFNTSDRPVSGVGAGVVQKAMQYVGYPYIWATAGPSSFDCSGFTSYVYKQMGYSFSTGSHEQYNEAGRWVNAADGLQAGDLLFFDTKNGGEISGGNAASHVGMYLGNGQMIHAANPNSGVIVSSINDPYYSGIYLGAKRVI